MRHSNSPGYRRHAGVTIIEVLFAIGIVVMGLMGIAGLIMIAGTQLTQGLKADGMSNLGLNAVEEFDMRHLRNQNGLLRYDTTVSTFNSFQTAESYCIDPYYISQQVLNNNTNIEQLSLFPGVAIPSGNPNQIAAMPRVTLASVPAILNDPALYDAGTYGVGVSRIMNKLQAQEIFTSKDNLAFRESDAATELPKQVWIDDRPLPTSVSPRTADGVDNDHDGFTDEADEAFVKRIGFGDMARLGATEFSWMATVTPNRFGVMKQGRLVGELNDQYLISIVVFHNRVLDQNNATLETPERVLKVTLRGNGFGGGEVRLHSDNLNALSLKHNDWIMLSAQSSLGPQFRWYRVTYIDDEVQTADNGTFYRDATLQGPDWNRNEWININHPYYRPTYATFVPHVIGVFEKTVRMETTSLY